MLAPRPVALSKRRSQTGEGGYVSGNVLVISAQETLRQEDWHDFKASQGCGMRNEFLVGCFVLKRTPSLDTQLEEAYRGMMQDSKS